MEFVINISKEVYENILKAKSVPDMLGIDIVNTINAIKNGIRLPEGHGELKDADVMINKLCTQEASELFGSVTCTEIMDFINDEKPIIGADRESEVMKNENIT